MEDNLKKIEEAAVKFASSDGSLEAIEKAASAIKSVNEARKAALESGREGWTRTLQLINILTPLAAVLTVS